MREVPRTRKLLMFQTPALPGEELCPDTQDHPLEPCQARFRAGHGVVGQGLGALHVVAG